MPFVECFLPGLFNAKRFAWAAWDVLSWWDALLPFLKLGCF